MMTPLDLEAGVKDQIQHLQKIRKPCKLFSHFVFQNEVKTFIAMIL